MLKRFLIILLSLALAGCATTYGKPITLQDISQLKKDITQEEIIELLGEPQAINLTANGKTIWVYVYTRSKTSTSTYIPVVNVLKSGAKVKTQMLQILFDENNIYQKHSFSDSEKRLKTGMF
ncbi:MAG: outer membrane protein assembly factor BamE [Candidatus Omnitrophica bacterium]|nr:outer membrane protein assembly factor BamE [Candidatus Omnitrophota bacterium]